MRKGTVLRLRGFGVFDFLSKNGLLIAILIGSAFGICFGVFSGEKFQVISRYSQNHLQRMLLLYSEHSFFRVFADAYMSALFSMLLLFASGTTVLGPLLVPLVAVGKSALLGAFPAMLYSHYSIKGIAFHAVLVLPPVFLFLIVYFLAVRESFRFSVLMAKMTLSGSSACDISGQFKKYCGRYLFLSFTAVLPAVLEAVLSLLLTGRFGLM